MTRQRQRLQRQRPADGSTGEALRRPQPRRVRGRCPQPGARRRSGNRRHNTRRRHRWHPGTGGRRRPEPQRGRAVSVGPRLEAAGHHDSARHDDGAGFPAADRPSADSPRRRATSPGWIVAGSSDSSFSLLRPRPGKDAAANHLLSRVGVAATSRHRNVRLILRGMLGMVRDGEENPSDSPRPRWEVPGPRPVFKVEIRPRAPLRRPRHPTRITNNSFGPWAPRTRIRSMSPVRLGPVMKESMLGSALS